MISKDPPSANSVSKMVLPRSIFDSSPERNVGVPMQRYECRFVPDELLKATLVDHGCPRWFAEEVERHPGVRHAALRFWCCVQDAAEGYKPAIEWLDQKREMWAEMRKVELISDRPGHTIGFWER